MEYNHSVSDALSSYPGVGGGDDYDPGAFTQPGWATGPRVTSSDADHVVRSGSELENAIESTSGGEVVWVPGDARVDVTGLRYVTPAANVTVASDRGLDGSDGALVESTESIHPLFKLTNAGVRFTGLQFLFPVTANQSYSSSDVGTGIAVDAEDVEIDNCVFRGFGHAGVEIGRGGHVGGTHIHHNHFVDNPMDSLGYGVVVYHGDPLVQTNYFDNNRHGIAAGGDDDCAYTAYYNVFGPYTVSHTLDMHEGNGGNGGRSFTIVQNVVLATERIDGHVESGIYIRGDPIEESVIAHNQFAHDSEPSGTGDWGDAYELSVSSVEGSNIVPTHNHYAQSSPAPIPEH